MGFIQPHTVVDKAREVYRDVFSCCRKMIRICAWKYLTWNRSRMNCSCCFVTFACLRTMSDGCLALNGYATQRITNTYSCIRFRLSSSSLSVRSRSVSRPSTLDNVDGEGLDGRATTPPDEYSMWLLLSALAVPDRLTLSPLPPLPRLTVDRLLWSMLLAGLHWEAAGFDSSSTTTGRGRIGAAGVIGVATTSSSDSSLDEGCNMASTRCHYRPNQTHATRDAWWLSGRAFDLPFTGRGFNSRPVCFYVT